MFYRSNEEWRHRAKLLPVGRLSEVHLPVTETGIGDGEYVQKGNLELCSVRGWPGMVGSKEMNSGEMEMEDRFNVAPQGSPFTTGNKSFSPGGALITQFVMLAAEFKRSACVLELVRI